MGDDGKILRKGYKILKFRLKKQKGKGSKSTPNMRKRRSLPKNIRGPKKEGGRGRKQE